jgi:hypothetical protein
MAQHRHYTNGTSDHVSVGIRASSSSSQQQKSGRVRRLGYRSDKSSRGGLSLIGAVIVFLCLALVVTVLAYYFLSNENTTNDKGLFFFFFWFCVVAEKVWENERKWNQSFRFVLIQLHFCYLVSKMLVRRERFSVVNHFHFIFVIKFVCLVAEKVWKNDWKWKLGSTVSNYAVNRELVFIYCRYIVVKSV